MTHFHRRPRRCPPAAAGLVLQGARLLGMGGLAIERHSFTYRLAVAIREGMHACPSFASPGIKTVGGRPLTNGLADPA